MRTLCILAMFLAAGCARQAETPKPEAGAKPEARKPITEQIRKRKPAAECTDEELAAREKENRAIGQLAKADNKQVQDEQTTRWVEGWERWSMLLGFGGLGLGLVAAFLIGYFLKNFRLAASVGGALVGLGGVAFLFAQIVAHWQAVMWTVLALGAVATAVAIYLALEGRYAKIREAFAITSRAADRLAETAGKAKDRVFGELLENAKLLNRDELKALRDKLPEKHQ